MDSMHTPVGITLRVETASEHELSIAVSVLALEPSPKTSSLDRNDPNGAAQILAYGGALIQFGRVRGH
jgi:hypothetical protein